MSSIVPVFLMGMVGMIGEFHWFDGGDDLDKPIYCHFDKPA